jgi:hypothetical protein
MSPRAGAHASQRAIGSIRQILHEKSKECCNKNGSTISPCMQHNRVSLETGI